MRRLPLALALGAILVPLVLLALPGTALAHDCSSPSDCEQTAGYNAVVAVVGGLVAIFVGIFSSSLGAAIGAVPVVTPEPAAGAPPDLLPEPVPADGGTAPGEQAPGPPLRAPAGADSGWGWYWDVALGTATGTASGVANVVTLGLWNAVGDNLDRGPGAIAGAVGNQVADVLTLGYWNGGISGVGRTLLPIDEVQVLLGPDATWDQRAGAAGGGILKLISLGRAGGHLISSRPLTPVEINRIRYGYHSTAPANVPGIMRSGLSATGGPPKGLASRGISGIARGYKNLFVKNEPPNAVYAWGTRKPGLGRVGDINYTGKPVVIDLRRLDPSKVHFRPADGAIVIHGDVPPSALLPYGRVPSSPHPVGPSRAQVPGAVGRLGGVEMADQLRSQPPPQ